MNLYIKNEKVRMIAAYTFMVVFSPFYFLGRLLIMLSKIVRAVGFLLTFNIWSAKDELRRIHKVEGSLKDAF